MNSALRFAGLALLSSWAMLLSPAAVASAMQEYAVWEVHARLNGEAQPTSRWLSQSELSTTVQLGHPLFTGRWNLQFSYVRNADGLPALRYALQVGHPLQDVTSRSARATEGDWHIIRVPGTSAYSELELRIRTTKIAVPTWDPNRTPVPAEYPPEALAQGIGGVVMLQVSMDENGVIQSARVEKASTPDVFEVPALTSAATWPLNPLRDESGMAVAGTVRIPVEFKVEPAAPPRQQRQRQKQENGEIKPRKKRKR